MCSLHVINSGTGINASSTCAKDRAFKWPNEGPTLLRDVMNFHVYFSHLLSGWPESQYKDQQMMLLSLCEFLENHCSKGCTFLVCDTPLHWVVVCWLLSVTHSNIGLFVCQLLSVTHRYIGLLYVGYCL